MDPTNAPLLVDIVACLHLVEDYTRRLDDACVEYYQTGKYQFPNLSRAEEEDMEQHCDRVLTSLIATIPDALNRWHSIKYPIDQYDQQIERSRDLWVRRRNLLRVFERQLRAQTELSKLAQPQADGGNTIVEPELRARSTRPPGLRGWIEHQRIQHGTMWLVAATLVGLVLAALALFV
jgi:hypothetical protein